MGVSEEIAPGEIASGEQRLSLLVASVRDYAIFMLDPRGYIETWNAGAERLKGYSASDIIGSHFSVFYTPEDIADGKPKRELEIATATGKYEEEGWRVRKDGTLFWANVVITAIRDERGVLVGFGKVTRDLTERKHAEEELRRAAAELEQRVIERTAQLEAANKELEAFGYSVSHDLRAPLRALDGFSKRVMTSAAARLDASELDQLQRVRAAAQRMSQLIDDMLNLSRITRSPMSPQSVDISALAHSIVDELRAADPSREVELIVAANLRALADPRQLRIALANLLGNAWKFTRKQAKARIEVGSSREDGKLVYFVRDNGVGFDLAYADKLFFPFQRMHSSREFEGTGIGLATVQRIVRRHGGSIWVDSAPGRGATFYFTVEIER